MKRTKIPNDFKRCGFEGVKSIICCKEEVLSSPFDLRSPGKVDRKSIQACQKIKEMVIPLMVSNHIIGGKPVEPGEFPHQAGEC